MIKKCVVFFFCFLFLVSPFLIFELPIKIAYAGTPAGTITYSPTTNTVTVAGANSTHPAEFLDLWNSDKAGTLDNAARTAVATVDADAVALDYNLRPTDYYVSSSGWLRTKLNFDYALHSKRIHF